MNKEESKNRTGIVAVYQAALIISLALVVFGTVCLIVADSVSGSKLWRNIGFTTLFTGCTTFMISEIMYMLIYSNKGIFSPFYLSLDIACGGFAAIVVSFIFLCVIPIFQAVDFNYGYAVFSVAITILFAVMLLFQKNRLRKTGVPIGRKVSIASVILGVITVAALIGVWFVFRHTDMFESNLLAPQMYYVLKYGVPQAEAKASLYSFMISALPLMLILIMNYIEMLIKSNHI